MCREHIGHTAATMAGFTIIELIISIMVLTVGILGVLGVMATVTAYQMRTASRDEMTGFLEGKLEELRAAAVVMSADSMQITMGGSLTSSQNDHSDEVTGPAGRLYILRWQVQAGPAGTRTVTLRIVPAEPSRRTIRQVEVTTLLYVPL